MNYYFKQSLEQKQPITIIYQSKDKLITERQIIVKKISSNKLIAYCYLRRQIRTFSIDHILSSGFRVTTKAI